MPTIRSIYDHNRYPEYPHYRVIVDNSDDLRGLDLSDARLYGIDLTGCLRSTTDPEIPGWFLTPEGTLVWVCDDCGEQRDYADRAPCNACSECCTHPLCRRCSEHCGDDTTRHCGDCDRCSNCCECIHCERCGENCTDEYCSDCSEDGDTRCHDCCNGHSSSEEPDEYEAGKPFPAGKDDSFTCKRLVGVEWEHNEAIDASTLHRQWRAGYHSDGSCGWELVTAPLAGDNIKDCLTDVAKAIEDAGANKDCGIHVHVDAADLSWTDMQRLLWVYARVEPVLYILGGQHRVNNTYCRPCGPDYSRALSDIDRKGSILAVATAIPKEVPTKEQAREYMRNRKGKFSKKHMGRYKGLNICPWIAGRQHQKKYDYNKEKYVPVGKRPDTTVEFRIHTNSLDAERVIGWAQLLARFVDWVSKASDKEAQSLPKSPLRALCMIAPDLAPWIMMRIRGWRNATSVARRARYNYRGNRPAPRRITIKQGEYACVA